MHIHWVDKCESRETCCVDMRCFAERQSENPIFRSGLVLTVGMTNWKLPYSQATRKNTDLFRTFHIAGIFILSESTAPFLFALFWCYFLSFLRYLVQIFCGIKYQCEPKFGLPVSTLTNSMVHLIRPLLFGISCSFIWSPWLVTTSRCFQALLSDTKLEIQLGTI